MIHSMTGYASSRFESGGDGFKLELKTLNHRFLDLKIRMPRDLAPLEPSIKALVESRLKRGSVDLWIERQSSSKGDATSLYNEPQARVAFEALNRMREQFGIREEIGIRDLISFPDVISRPMPEGKDEAALQRMRLEMENAVASGLESLIRMKQAEGGRLAKALLGIVQGLEDSHQRLLQQRDVIRNRAKEKVRRRIELCFEAYPTVEERVRSLLETRISQEITHALEKLDIEEELTRFHGHLLAIRELLEAGGAVGKRLDFLFQELNREINTLGNKSQDLEISKEVIDMKMRVEQMREQSLNLE
ncbi:MAG: YicC family protein [Bdellovibrionales bacterium]|nr:YicC family protein [Bdellovibrionales bacterium]